MRDALTRPEDFRRETRHKVCADAKIPVRIGWSVDGCEQTDQGEVLDISCNGARLSFPQQLPADKPLELHVDVEGLALKLDIPAQVRWSTIRNSEQWCVGCIFQNEIESQVLTQLASAGYLERRQEHRQPVSLETEARWELTQGSVPVRLTNLSVGGFGFACQVESPLGDRLLLELKLADGSHLRIPAKVQWHSRAEGDADTVFGCQFVNRTSFGKLREYLEMTRRESQPAVGRRPFGLRPWLLIGLLGVLLWVSLRNWLS